ncbi:MAG TPA: Flp family type IVb pilin [Dehalococcoidia bacterium]|nr:Flp family type IVb pilin [Dehalococcoidia bacterium]
MRSLITVVSELVYHLRRQQHGQGLVEYALILAFVAIAAIGALGILSGGINGIFTSIGGTLAGA